MVRNSLIFLLYSLILYVLALFCSCGTLKKTTNKRKIQTDSTSKMELRGQTLTVETFEVDTFYQLPKHVLSGEVDMPIEDDTATIEDEHLKVSLTKNKTTGKLQIIAQQKPKTVPVKAKATKTTFDSWQQKSETQLHKKEKALDRDKERKGLMIPWYVYVCLSLVALITIGIWAARQYQKRALRIKP